VFILSCLLSGLTLVGFTSAQTSPVVPALPPKAAAAATPASPAVNPASAAPSKAAMSRDAVLARGRQLVTWFYAQNLDPVWAAFQPTARANFGGDLSVFKAYRKGGVTTYGKETRLLGEEVTEQDGVTYYLRSATFERGPKVIWTVAFGLDTQGRVVDFGILGGTEPDPGQSAGSRNGRPD
jgi:hypothetical protein